MKNLRPVLICLALLGLALLAGCGNKGELVRPSDATETPAGN